MPGGRAGDHAVHVLGVDGDLEVAGERVEVDELGADADQGAALGRHLLGRPCDAVGVLAESLSVRLEVDQDDDLSHVVSCSNPGNNCSSSCRPRTNGPAVIPPAAIARSSSFRAVSRRSAPGSREGAEPCAIRSDGGGRPRRGPAPRVHDQQVDPGPGERGEVVDQAGLDRVQDAAAALAVGQDREAAAALVLEREARARSGRADVEGGQAVVRDHQFEAPLDHDAERDADPGRPARAHGVGEFALRELGRERERGEPRRDPAHGPGVPEVEPGAPVDREVRRGGRDRKGSPHAVDEHAGDRCGGEERDGSVEEPLARDARPRPEHGDSAAGGDGVAERGENGLGPAGKAGAGRAERCAGLEADLVGPGPGRSPGGLGRIDEAPDSRRSPRRRGRFDERGERGEPRIRRRGGVPAGPPGFGPGPPRPRRARSGGTRSGPRPARRGRPGGRSRPARTRTGCRRSAGGAPRRPRP